MDIKHCIKLSNGVEIPQLALGVSEMDDEGTANAVGWALEAGYRHFDTASYYNTENGIRIGLERAGARREDVFLTTKLWNDDMRQNRVEAAFEDSLRQLGTDYVDLYLVHWPVAEVYVPAWKILEKLYEQGRIRAIGVSNFNANHIETLRQSAKYMPMVNQFEIHPKMTQVPLRSYCKENNIATAACSPLGTPWGDLLQSPKMLALATQYGCTAAQLVIRWHLQSGTIALPKSSKQARIIENSCVFGFTIAPEDMAYIDSLNEGKYVGPDPDHFDF